VETCIKAGCPAGGLVLDPFCGSGTTALVAQRLGRDYLGIDCVKEYCQMARKRLAGTKRIAL
jgi:DNA modification methylase